MANQNGRPEITEEQFHAWFDDLSPFFKLGESLLAAIEDAGLWSHKTVIYEKVKENDWFAEKMQAYQSYPGKLANNILVKSLMEIDDRMKQGRTVTEDDMKNVRFIAEKHRTAQTYFVSRTETAVADPSDVGKILDRIETDYDQLAKDAGREASKQVVETDTPVQN